MEQHDCTTQCPITTTEFRDKVLVGLENLQTKMDSLVGEKGTNGRIGTLEETVSGLKFWQGMLIGAWTLFVVATPIVVYLYSKSR